MFRRTPVAASAALFLVALATLPPDAGARPLPTRDGRCALWVSADGDPRPGDSASWSGGCRDGLGQGFGIHELARADGSRLRYIGHVREGRWHGLGRLHHWAVDGRLLHVAEGVFERGVEQGVFQELVADHPQNGPLDALRPPGHAVGLTAVQLQQFYTDGAAVLMCAPDADCTRHAPEEGLALREPDLGEGMNRPLPLGGWRLELRAGGRPVQTGICLEASHARPGHEPRVGTVLFPSFSAWQEPLRSDRQCDDLSAVLDGPTLTWTSQCQLADGSERTSIAQRRSVGDREVRSQTEVVVTRRGRESSRVARDVTARYVGACTGDMTRAGQLGL
jgi:hypothetical protein